MKPSLKSKASSRIQLNKFNYQSSPLPSLQLPQIINIISLEMSVNNGQGGVVFIELAQGSFIIKPSLTIPNQLFYNQLATELGLRVPQMNFFSHDDPSHRKIFKAIQNFCKEKDECLLARLRSKFSNLFYGIIQYIPSISFENLGKQRFQKYMLSPQKVYELGTCLGYDMIINNQDRFQLLWSGDGNVGNVLIQVAQHHEYSQVQLKHRQNITANLNSYIFIDNEGHMCEVTGGSAVYIAKYFQKVAKVCEFLLQNQIQVNSQQQLLNKNVHLLKLIQQIQLYTGHKLDNRQCKEISYGIIDVLQKFISIHKIGIIQKLFFKMLERSKEIQCNIISQQWLSQLKNIDMSYCNLLMDNLKPIFKNHNQKIKTKKKSIIQTEVLTVDSPLEIKQLQIEIQAENY